MRFIRQVRRMLLRRVTHPCTPPRDTPRFAWQPIPPSAEFVAMGMVATKSEEAPSVRSVHCVPVTWIDAAP